MFPTIDIDEQTEGNFQEVLEKLLIKIFGKAIAYSASQSKNIQTNIDPWMTDECGSLEVIRLEEYCKLDLESNDNLFFLKLDENSLKTYESNFPNEEFAVKNEVWSFLIGFSV